MTPTGPLKFLPGLVALVLLAAGLGHAFRHEWRWVALNLPHNRWGEGFYERSWRADDTIRPRRRVLINLQERGDRNEASRVFEFEFDCFYERLTELSEVRYFDTFGEGAVVRRVPERSLWGVTGTPPGQALRAICAPILSRANRPVENIEPWGFPFAPFLTCTHRRDHSGRAYLEAMRKKLVPQQKQGSAWTYRTEGVLSLHGQNLPVTETHLGVCSRGGDVACGQSAYTALQFDMPMAEVRRRLRLLGNGWGVDYTVEDRYAESAVTRRPVLMADPKDSRRSFLYCDSGNL